MHEYGTARGVLSFAEFLAWALVVGGAIIAIAGFSAGSAVSGFGRGGGLLAGMMAALPGLGMSSLGLLVVVFVQIGRAGVDTSERVGRLIAINRDGFQYLKSENKELPKSFAHTASVVGNHAPATEAASTPQPAVERPSSNSTIEYKGRHIRVDERGVPWIGEQDYVSLEAAKAYVNQLPPAQETEVARGIVS